MGHEHPTWPAPGDLPGGPDDECHGAPSLHEGEGVAEELADYLTDGGRARGYADFRAWRRRREACLALGLPAWPASPPTSPA